MRFLGFLGGVFSVLVLAGLLLASPLAGTARASTLNEADLPAGAFSPLWSAPTQIGAGITQISGTGSGGVYDNFVLTALPAGAQTLTFTFTAPQGIGWSYSAGGILLYSQKPFRFGWDGTPIGGVGLSYFTRAQSHTLTLGPGFSGPLYVALNFTYGTVLPYTIDIPSNATASPPPISAVPLPAGALLLGAGLVPLIVRRRAGA